MARVLTLPDLPPLPDQGRSRTSRGRINDVTRTPGQRQATVAASGSPIAILYGRVRVGGRIFAIGFLGPDLVVGVAWGLGPIDAIEAVYLLDEDVPVAVTQTHYTGSVSQTPDPTLQAADLIASSTVYGYNDDLILSIAGQAVPVAYSVLQIPDSVSLDGNLTIHGVLRGRLLYDPRTAQDPDDPGTWTWSENPALALADLARSPVYGAGRAVVGLEATADWNDQLVTEGDPRCRIGLAVQAPALTHGWLDVLSEYAQCYWVHEGDTIRLIPDAPAEPARVFAISDMLRDSFAPRLRSLSNQPTSVEVRRTVPLLGSPLPWDETSARDQIDGVTAGTVLDTPSTIRMEGIFRDGEATRVARQRLRRMRISREYSFTTHDDGVFFQRGDIVTVRRDERGLDQEARILGVDLVSPGRYRVTCEDYSDDLVSNATGSPDPEAPALIRLVERVSAPNPEISSRTVTFSSVPQNGEIILLLVMSGSNNVSVPIVPGGFSLIASHGAVFTGLAYIYAKFANSEPGPSYSVNMGGNLNMTGHRLHGYRIGGSGLQIAQAVAHIASPQAQPATINAAPADFVVDRESLIVTCCNDDDSLQIGLVYEADNDYLPLFTGQAPANSAFRYYPEAVSPPDQNHAWSVTWPASPTASIGLRAAAVQITSSFS